MVFHRFRAEKRRGRGPRSATRQVPVPGPAPPRSPFWGSDPRQRLRALWHRADRRCTRSVVRGTGGTPRKHWESQCFRSIPQMLLGN